MSQENKPAKSTNAQMQERIDEVMLQLLTGSSRAQILQYATKYDVCDKTVDTLIARARDAIKEIAAPDRMAAVDQVMGNLWFLYKQALKAGDRRLSLDVLKEVAKVKGLNELTLIHKMGDRDLKDADDSELDAITKT